MSSKKTYKNHSIALRYWLIYGGIFFLSSCLWSEEAGIAKAIEKQYAAEEVRTHYTEEKSGSEVISVAEIIILNSAVLRNNNSDLEECLMIARRFHAVLKNQKEYNGIRVIISHKNGGEAILGLSKGYYYDKKILQ